MNKQQLASKIWESANKMRSKIEANEYKDYILGFIFYKFLSDKELKYLKEDLEYEDEDLDTVTEEDEEIVENVRKNLGYFISYESLFSTWLNKGIDFNVADVRDALSAFSRLINPSYKNVFDKVFDTLHTGLSKLGDSSASQTKAISDLLNLIKDIPMDGKQDYDVLGFIYEYLISNFAANAGKKAGEFYTPHEVSLLMSEIVAQHLKDRSEIKIYDPTSGSGSLLINIGQSVAKYTGDSKKIKYYAQELRENTYNLTRMNLVMRGILPSNIVTRNADTLEEDWPYFEENDPTTYEPLFVDAVVSNPPYSQNWNPSGKETDDRYKRFGLAPKSKADYAFLLHDLFHIKQDGIMTIVLPHGVLFRGGEEGTIRKNLIENNHIDTIIGLPANIFFGTGIPTIIMVLKQKRENTDVLIIDASKGFEKVGKNNRLRACDIKKIADTVEKRCTIDKYSRKVTRNEIRANDYNLNIPRYVDSSEKPESWGIYASMFGGIPETELAELKAYWQAFPNLKADLFKSDNGAYYDVCTDDIKATVKAHIDISTFTNSYISSFGGFDEWLKKELFDNMTSINISKEESILSEEIFTRLGNMPLVDVYEAYQILDNDWQNISVDLEIIQTEGFEATKQVDPEMVIKKKNNKEVEEQIGWVGHILPFKLVQNKYLSSELEDLTNDEEHLSNIPSRYEEELDNLSEDEKEKDFINDDKTAFVWSEVKKAIKAKEVEDDVLAILKKVLALNEEEKKLKKQIKIKSEALHLKTKSTIENLSDEQVYELLYDKWIMPLIVSLNKLPETIVDNFTSKLEKLAEKYSTTLSGIDAEIKQAEKELSTMLDELVGNEFDMMGIAELKKMLGGN